MDPIFCEYEGHILHILLESEFEQNASKIIWK